MSDAVTETSGAKPTLLFIRHPLTGGLLHQLWEQPYITSFQRRFNVILVEEDCDLSALCDRHAPDLIVFRGAYSAPHRRINVANAHTNRHIPRVALALPDCFCTSRIANFQDMEAWGCEVWLAPTSFAEHAPEAASRAFGMPLIFDDQMCVDHGFERDIPIWTVGALTPDRPWRVRTVGNLNAHFPDQVQSSPHPGYGREVKNGLVGADFFRTMARARFSLTDGTIFHAVVRKHLEIPACGTVLLAEPMECMPEYGFVDMENCVLDDGEALMDKVALLLKDEDRRRAIARAGHDLVHSRHAASKSDFLYNWFMAWRALRPGQTLVQHGLFGPYEAVSDGRQGLISSYTWAPDLLSRMIGQGEQDYARGDYAAAAKQAQAALDIRIEHAPARFLLNRVLLRQGRAAEVIQPQVGLFQFNFSRTYYATTEPDPVELAWWVFAHICDRQLDLAAALLTTFGHIRHAELRRVAWLVSSLKGRAAPLPAAALPDDRPSVMHLTASSFTTWMAEILPLLNLHWNRPSGTVKTGH